MYQGLANVGNTCSINTLIQCIGHCPSFRNHILTAKNTINKTGDRHYSIYEELKCVFTHLWINDNSIVPKRFISAFYESIGDSYTIGEQLDFTEMWMLLLDNLIAETHDADFKANHQHVRQYKDPMLMYMQDKSQRGWDRFFAKNTNSPLNDLLYGIQIQQTKCIDCSKIYHNVEPTAFHYLETIDCPTMAKGFEKLLDHETMIGWKCDKCKNENGHKFILFWKLPKIWMIVLQRFNTRHKVIVPIDILQFLSIDNNAEMASSEDPKCANYELKAIANHYGSLNGGHYTAICKNDGEGGGEGGGAQWYEYDDIRVSKIDNIAKVFTQNTDAYALFYERFD